MLNYSIQTTSNHLEAFSREGFRTLGCAMKDIAPEDYEEWKTGYQRASTSLQNRQENVSRAADLIERNLQLLGVTAVEDKLQRGVSIQLFNQIELNN